MLNMYGMTEIGAASCCRPRTPPRSATTRSAVRSQAMSCGVVRASGDEHGRAGGDGRGASRHRRVRGARRLRDRRLSRPPRGQDEPSTATGFARATSARSTPAGTSRSRDGPRNGARWRLQRVPRRGRELPADPPGIGQAAVIGVPHAAMGETLHAFVVPEPDAELEPRDVVGFARAGIAGYKVPYGVSVLRELPLLASGKPDRRALARSFKPMRRGSVTPRLARWPPARRRWVWPTSSLHSGRGLARATRRADAPARVRRRGADLRGGRASDRLWLITGGPRPHPRWALRRGAGEVVARQRKGDAMGAQGAITGEPRTGQRWWPRIPTTALELDGERFLELAQRFPGILVNLIRIQSERLVIANARRVERERGESVALLQRPRDGRHGGARRRLRAALSPRPVIWLDRRLSFAGTLTAADDLTDEHATVLLPGELDPETLRCCSTKSTASWRWSARRAKRSGWVRSARRSAGRARRWRPCWSARRRSRPAAAGRPTRRSAWCARCTQADGGGLAERRPGVAGAPSHAHEAGTGAGRRRREGVRAHWRAAGARAGRLCRRLRVGQQHRRDRRRLPGAGDGRRGDRRDAARAPSTPATWPSCSKPR